MSDLERLKSEYCFAANKIHLAFDQCSWRPTYYLAEDPLVMARETLLKCSDAAEISFFPQRHRSDLAKIGFDEGVFYNLVWEHRWTEEDSEILPKFGDSPITRFYWGSTVTYSAIQMAFYMGFDRVYLIGVDCSYVAPSNIKAGDTILTSGGEPNYFSPDYNPPGSKTYPPNVDRHIKSFKRACAMTDLATTKIYNATRGGNLEVFPRVEFDSLF